MVSAARGQPQVARLNELFDCSLPNTRGKTSPQLKYYSLKRNDRFGTQSIMHYNGGAVLAMVGKDCVAIGCDKRLGVQALTVSTEFPKVFKVHDRLFFGLAGLASDVATVHEHIRFKTNMYKLQENRDIEPKTLGHLISSTLYERRFGPYFIEPVIAGLDKHDKPFICSADLIGCLNFAKDFVVAGVPSANLFGMCEGLWEEGLGPDDLFETCAQALLNAVDRDALSGWGGVIHVITKEGVTTRHLKGRMD